MKVLMHWVRGGKVTPLPVRDIPRAVSFEAALFYT